MENPTETFSNFLQRILQWIFLLVTCFALEILVVRTVFSYINSYSFKQSVFSNLIRTWCFFSCIRFRIVLIYSLFARWICSVRSFVNMCVKSATVGMLTTFSLEAPIQTRIILAHGTREHTREREKRRIRQKKNGTNYNTKT